MFGFLFKNPFNSPKFSHFALILARISIGLFFLTTGYNKLFVEKNQQIMLETIVSTGIPFPEVTAIIVSLFEFVLGLLLTIGLFTQLTSLILIFICFVALVTVGIYTIPPGLNLITWISWFFYTHDLLYIFILLFIFTNKPDSFTLDKLFSKILLENNHFLGKWVIKIIYQLIMMYENFSLNEILKFIHLNKHLQSTDYPVEI